MRGQPGQQHWAAYQARPTPAASQAQPHNFPAAAPGWTLPGARPRHPQAGGDFSLGPTVCEPPWPGMPAAGAGARAPDLHGMGRPMPAAQPGPSPQFGTIGGALGSSLTSASAGSSGPAAGSLDPPSGGPSSGAPAASSPSTRDRGKPHRAMSMMSQEAIDGLCKTSMELSALEDEVERIVARLENGEITPGQARTQLSNIEAVGHKVECDKVDSIYTSELHSGKEMAKTQKKDQLKRLERLFERLEILFKWIKTLEP